MFSVQFFVLTFSSSVQPWRWHIMTKHERPLGERAGALLYWNIIKYCWNFELLCVILRISDLENILSVWGQLSRGRVRTSSGVGGTYLTLGSTNQRNGRLVMCSLRAKKPHLQIVTYGSSVTIYSSTSLVCASLHLFWNPNKWALILWTQAQFFLLFSSLYHTSISILEVACVTWQKQYLGFK